MIFTSHPDVVRFQPTPTESGPEFLARNAPMLAELSDNVQVALVFGGNAYLNPEPGAMGATPVIVNGKVDYVWKFPAETLQLRDQLQAVGKKVIVYLYPFAFNMVHDKAFGQGGQYAMF